MSFRTARLDWLPGLGIAIVSAIALYPNISVAQITPDGTLPNNSNVTLEDNTFKITGGSQARGNLFHSFKDFSIPTGLEAFFNNAANIQNIISRVTGKSISNIDGLIQANGTANLFLINPNGIIFGENARLNIGGSFFATSANSMKFADGFEFSAKNPQSTPLLTINVPIGLQFGSNTGSISVRGSNLQVNPAKSLILVGGNVSMDGSQLVAPSGRVELGGIAGENTVGVFSNGDFLGLNFPQGVSQADVSLTNQAEVNVLASRGGSIAVNAANLNISEGSQLITGISGVGSSKTQAGDIKINATGIVAIADSSNISNQVLENAVGNSGNININADSLSLSNNSFLAASTNGRGNAGKVTINTNSLSVFEDSFLAASANGEGDAGNIIINARDRVLFDLGGQAYTNVTTKGKGGDISISTGLLTVTNGSKLNASTSGVGDAGNLTFSTRSFFVTNNSEVTASTSGVGKAGDLTINTDSLFVNNESFLAASANGQNGDAGNITINTRDTVSFENGAKVYTDVNQVPFSGTTEVEGNGGDIKITSGLLSLTNGAQLISNTQGKGNAGNITIDTGALSVTNESFLAASANGENGDAGNITINARDRVSFEKGAKVYTNVNQLFGDATEIKGDGGNIKITSASLSLTDGSILNASTSAVGNAGKISFSTGSFSVTNNSEVIASTSGVGNAGNITIDTDSLSVTNESFLAASANGRGNAGNISINARNSVSFENGAKVYTDVNQLFGDTTEVKGDGGNIKITSESLSLTNGAQLISNTQGEGNAGSITIKTGVLSVTSKSFLAASANGENGDAGNITFDVRDRILFDQGSAFSNVGVCSLIAVGCAPSNNTIKGNGGNISIKAPSLQLINGSFLATGVGDDNNLGKQVEGNAGNISIYLRDDLSLVQSFITTRLFANGKGTAGNIDIQAGLISSHQSLISASTQGQGNAGGISVQTMGAISLADSDISTAVQKGATGDAQGIKITAESLFLTDGAQLNTVTSAEGKAGNIVINTTDKVSVSGTNTTVAPTYLFQNNIPPRFNSPPQFVDAVSSGIFTSTNSSGVGGNITVDTNTFSISNSAIVDARTTASGTGGTININTKTFEAISGGQLTAITSGSGRAGSITLNATDSATITDSDPTYWDRLAQFGADNIDIYGKPKVGNQGAASGLAVSSVGSGSAGDLTVQADFIHLNNGAKISADTTGGGGNIFLNLPLLFLRQGSSITTNASGNDITGGNISIDGKNGFIVAVPKENSDIRADSANSRGGNVTIKNIAGIFGIQSRNEPSPNTSDITAKGATPDLSGNVQITTPDVDPTRGLVELPTNLVDASRQISNACTPGTRQFQNTFVVTGRGGLPMSPTEPLQDSSTVSAWVRLRPTSENLANTMTQLQPTAVSTTPIATATPIVEASGWVVDSNGNIELVAQANQMNFHSPFASCPVSQ